MRSLINKLIALSLVLFVGLAVPLSADASKYKQRHHQSHGFTVDVGHHNPYSYTYRYYRYQPHGQFRSSFYRKNYYRCQAPYYGNVYDGYLIHNKCRIYYFGHEVDARTYRVFYD